LVVSGDDESILTILVEFELVEGEVNLTDRMNRLFDGELTLLDGVGSRSGRREKGETTKDR
jgi:hypothetical protein